MRLKKRFGLLLVLLLTPIVLVGVVQSVAPPTIYINVSSYGINVIGSGWTPNAPPVILYYDVVDAAHEVATVWPNYAGNFQTYIPTNYVATVGAHTVKARQGVGNFADAEYNVGVVSPPDDRLLNPIKSIKDKLDTVGSEVQAIEAKLDAGGSFYNFVDAWFVTVDDKIDVVDGKVDDVDDKIDTRMDALEDQLADKLEILACYEGVYDTGGELGEDTIVPGSHIETDKPVLFTVTYVIYPDDDYDFFVNTDFLPGTVTGWANWDVESHKTDEVRHNSITFGGTSVWLELWEESDVWGLFWRILVQGTPDTVVTVIE